MVAKHAHRADLDRVDVRFVFWPSDMVLLQTPWPGKLKARAIGPFTFLHYMGWHGVNDRICNITGMEWVVSAANLKPFNPHMHVDRYQEVVEQG